MNDKEKKDKIDQVVDKTLAGLSEIFEPLRDHVNSEIDNKKEEEKNKDILSLKDRLLSKFK